LTVIQVVQKATTLKAHLDPVVIPGYGHGLLWNLGQASFSLAKARSIPCLFYGGPPSCHQKFKGTLLEMFVDRVMMAIFLGNYDALDQILPAIIKEKYGQ
jgi:hypothetical protein